MVDRELGYFFRTRLLFWRFVLAVRALRYLRNYRLFFAHMMMFLTCSLHRAFKELDRESNPYGETPYSTLDKMALRFGIVSRDVLFDLGSGRGLGAFWWAERVGCTVYGIEEHSYFVRLANRMKRYLSNKVSFIERDYSKIDLSEATVIYLYGTALSDAMIERMIASFKNCKRQTKIITVSYPLSAYSNAFTTVKQFRGRFPWGSADVYLNRLKEGSRIKEEGGRRKRRIKDKG